MKSSNLGIKGDERKACIDYLKKEYGFQAFYFHEESLHFETDRKHFINIEVDSELQTEVLNSANRRVEASKEIINRRTQVKEIPEVAKPVFIAWGSFYDVLAELTIARGNVIEGSPKVDKKSKEDMLEQIMKVLIQNNLFDRLQESRVKARNAEGDFINKLGLTDSELDEYKELAKVSVINDNWLN